MGCFYFQPQVKRKKSPLSLFPAPLHPPDSGTACCLWLPPEAAAEAHVASQFKPCVLISHCPSPPLPLCLSPLHLRQASARAAAEAEVHAASQFKPCMLISHCPSPLPCCVSPYPGFSAKLPPEAAAEARAASQSKPCMLVSHCPSPLPFCLSPYPCISARLSPEAAAEAHASASQAVLCCASKDMLSAKQCAMNRFNRLNIHAHSPMPFLSQLSPRIPQEAEAGQKFMLPAKPCGDCQTSFSGILRFLQKLMNKYMLPAKPLPQEAEKQVHAASLAVRGLPEVICGYSTSHPPPTFHPPTFHPPTFHPPTFHPPTFHLPTFHPPTFHPPTFHPPTFHPPTFHPPTFHPPTFHPPTFHPPTFHPPTFHPPTFHPLPGFLQKLRLPQEAEEQVHAASHSMRGLPEVICGYITSHPPPTFHPLPGFRKRLRQKYMLPAKPCGDCCVHTFCFLCAISQEHRELKIRGWEPKLGKSKAAAQARKSETWTSFLMCAICQEDCELKFLRLGAEARFLKPRLSRSQVRALHWDRCVHVFCFQSAIRQEYDELKPRLGSQARDKPEAVA
ncbi:unnamed protein product [Closterium sp. NIES-64]|nr:unnamed protein product [Closterium sp. NIES-64]